MAETAISRPVNETGAVIIGGANFSGRSEFIRAATGFAASSRFSRLGCRGAYVGPEVYNSLSALAQTVFQELRINGRDPNDNFLRDIGISDLLSRNPFTLSGGEQVLVAIASASANRYDVIGLDCATEQLDTRHRAAVFEYLSAAQSSLTFVVDNRTTDGEAALFRSARNFQCEIPGRFEIAPDQLSEVPVDPVPLRIEDLWFRYSKEAPWVLKRCSATLEPGRVHVLSGPNGIGKSTFAKLLTGVLKPQRGKIHVLYRNGRYTDLWQRPGSVVAYHFQNPDLQLFATTVQDEMRLSLRDTECEDLSRFGQSVVSSFGLSGLLEEHPLDLPFVLRKRVAVAATVAMARPWLILDEPIVSQDQNAALRMSEIVKQLSRDGVGIIIISHSGWFDGLFDAIQLRICDGELIV